MSYVNSGGGINAFQITRDGKRINSNPHHESHISASTNEVVFPSLKGWLKIQNVLRQATWEYIRLKEDDTLETHFFCTDRPACQRTYENIIQKYFGMGTGRRV